MMVLGLYLEKRKVQVALTVDSRGERQVDAEVAGMALAALVSRGASSSNECVAWVLKIGKIEGEGILRGKSVLRASSLQPSSPTLVRNAPLTTYIDALKEAQCFFPSNSICTSCPVTATATWYEKHRGAGFDVLDRSYYKNAASKEVHVRSRKNRSAQYPC